MGCGSIYLADWVNVDLPGEKTFLASDRPDLVAKWWTTEDHYYARHEDKTIDTLRAGPLDQEYVCDRYGSFEFIPAQDGTVTEILSRQVFEHLDNREAKQALTESHRVLIKGGHLRIDVPDADETLRRYIMTGDEFFIRHLLGPRRDLHGSHKHYTRDMLRVFVEEHGFTFEEEEFNIHDGLYDAFCLRFRRA